MEILSKDSDLRFLHGTELSQVCVGENEVILRLGEGVEITVEVPILHSRLSGTDLLMSDFRRNEFSLNALLGESIKWAVLRSDSCLELRFSNGDILTINSDGSGYEAFQIRKDESVIVAY